jgi:hypothetical protein
LPLVSKEFTMANPNPVTIDATPIRTSPEPARGAAGASGASPGKSTATSSRATFAARPKWKRVLIGVLALLYVLSPLDLVPDVIPIVGWLDDLGVLAWAARQVFFRPKE